MTDPGAGSLPSPNRRLFRFGASDGNYQPNGPASQTAQDLSILQGFLGTAQGPSITPTSYQCHFGYYPAAGTLYLDSPADNYSYPYSSAVPVAGQPAPAGVQDLSNGTCKPHTATSSVSINGPNLEIVLDIEFLQIGTWYMYETVRNSLLTSTANPGGTDNTTSNQVNPPWSYWGYWTVAKLP